MFSVRENSKVRFALGNLRYSAGDNSETWAFERSKYDCRTWHINDSDTVVIDGVTAQTPLSDSGYFYWSKDKAVICSRNHSDDGRDADDTFALADTTGFGLDGSRQDEIHDCILSGFDVLSYDERAYLRYERQEYDEKVGLATITGIGGNDWARGVVLLPDSWTFPPGLTFYSECGNGWATNS